MAVSKELEKKPAFANSEDAKRFYFALFREHEITYSSKWDEVLELLGNNDRFNTISSLKERKNIFKKFIEFERLSYRRSIYDMKRNQRDDFKRMLEEYQHINIDTKISSLLPIFYQDPRWIKMDEKEREEAFLEYMDELFRKEADGEKHIIAQQCEKLKKQMLEIKKINSNSTWEEIQEVMRFNNTWNELHNYYKLKSSKKNVQRIYHESSRVRAKGKRN